MQLITRYDEIHYKWCFVYHFLYCLAAACILCLDNISSTKDTPYRFYSIDAFIIKKNVILPSLVSQQKTTFSLPMLHLLLQRQLQPSLRARLPGLCFPKRASQACVPRASAPAAVTPQAVWQPSASSGVPAFPPSRRPTRLTAHRVTPAGRLTVSLNHSIYLCASILSVHFIGAFTNTYFTATWWVHHHQTVYITFFYVFPSWI